MEKWKVVGFRKVQFTDPQGRNVSGFSLFLARPAQNPDVVGLEVQRIFISSQYVDYTPKENQLVNILYNRYGKVASVTPIEV